MKVCGPADGVRVTGNGIHVYDLIPPHRLTEALTADTVLIPGVSRTAEPWPDELLDVLREAHLRGARITSICSGAFVLAAAGLLDHRRATTHWAYAKELAERYPALRVDPSVLYIDDGDVLTSAGVAAGLDLCLHRPRRDRRSQRGPPRGDARATRRRPSPVHRL